MALRSVVIRILGIHTQVILWMGIFRDKGNTSGKVVHNLRGTLRITCFNMGF